MNHLAYDISRGLLRVFFGLGFGLEVRGAENVPREGAFILASNHASFLDPPVLGAACPRRLSFLARDTLFRNALLGAYFRAVHVMPLKRGVSDIAAIRLAIQRLREGGAVAIFPEGTRAESPGIRPAKRGVEILASQSGAPIVPAVLTGTFEALPRHRSTLRRSKIRVAFGEPILYTRRPSAPESESQSGPAKAAGVDPGAKHQEPRGVAALVTERWNYLAAQLGENRSEA